jgi:hypothetical protein
LTGGIFWFCSASAGARLEKQGHFDDEVLIPPGKEFGYVIIVGPISSHYHFSVTSLDGRAVMAVARVDDGDTDQMTPRDLERVMDDAIEVGPGTTQTRSGEMTRGRYLWVVVNPTDKPLRVKIQFG